MTDCGITDVGKCIVTECLWPRIERHFDYWRRFRDNIRGLRDEVGYLERERRNMDQKIVEARLRAESLTTEVENWSKDGTQKLEEAESILQACDDLRPWNIISRYSKGKGAKKIAEGIVKLRSEGNLIRISDPAPLPSQEPIPHETTMEFESRRRIEEDIMEFLNDDHVRMVAICGAGGVGKTTMARRIEDRVREEKLFDEVVHVVVSQQFDMLKIQKEISELLGLNLTEETLVARAHKLHIRLRDSKRKLIVFDDVWKRFNLIDLGIPLANDFVSCKIILTSRVKDACRKMNARIIPMEVLTKEEAWALFKEKAGSCVEDSDLRPIAEHVAAECNGLPVALVTVGEALKDQNIPMWKDSLSQLRRSIPMDFPELIEDVYKPLKLSYDFLETESVKSLFLLCCLFPEDYEIPNELLTLFSIGLGMFEGIRNIEEGRSRAHSLVDKLKSRFLLVQCKWHNHIGEQDGVKMHDVIRDVAIFIGSKEKHGFLKSLEVSSMDFSSEDSPSYCNWMSIDISIENANRVGSDFPNLLLLVILKSSFDQSFEVFDANIIYFEGMKELNVLCFSNINLESLPPTLECLKKLRTLYLEKCKVRDISIVGELASLEILYIHRCDNIEELPANIGKLNRLRLLEVTLCEHLKRIVAGVISSLVGLEELKIFHSFDKWETMGNQSGERNASLSELRSLPNLSCLEIEISDCNLVAQEICLSLQLVRYLIFFKGCWGFYRSAEHDRSIALNLPGDIVIGNWIHQLVRSTQSLSLTGDGSNNFNLAEAESMMELIIADGSMLKKLVNASDSKFPELQSMLLRNLKELEEIITGTIPYGSNSFPKLEKLTFFNLPKLAHLWKSLDRNGLPGNLKHIRIEYCPNLRYLFSVPTTSDTDASIIEFPKLKRLMLEYLPNLAAFSLGVEIIEFPQLTKLRIKGCPKLKTKIGRCPNLRSIQVSAFNGLHYLLSSCCTTKWNMQLEELSIEKCTTIKEILWAEIEDKGTHHIIFPELMILQLIDLPCLTTFYRGVESIRFPKLKFMTIGNLPRLCSLSQVDSEPTHDDHSFHFFCNKMVEIPNLNTLYIRNFQDNISKIWCRHVPTDFFRNLRWLDIANVNGIRNFMSSSIAQNLVNLGYLKIERCQEIIQVIADENEVFVTSLFPNLTCLVIKSLHKLKCFCQWKHALELPSLERMEFDDCPAMEAFTLGSLSIPKLSKFLVNNKEVMEVERSEQWGIVVTS